MRKILLCALNSKFIHSSLAVHSIKTAYDFYCQSILHCESNAMPELSACEFTINDSHPSVLYKITAEHPDIVAFSVYLWNASFISALCKDIKACFPQCKIILGGPEVSYGVDSTLFSEDMYDFVIAGEGEKAFFALAYLLSGKPHGELPEEFRIQVYEKVVKATTAAVLDDLPFVYNVNNLPLFKNRIVYYESSRGCPFSCAYCLSSAEHGVRFLSLERVFEDLKFFIENDVPLVKFVDRTFNCNKKRSYDILKFIIENSKNTCFHFEVAADLFDAETLSLLKAAPRGRIQFEIGIQTTNDKALKASCRAIDNTKVFKNIKELTSMKNINIHADLIAGLPYEGYADFANTFNETYEYCTDKDSYIHQLQIGFLKLLHGAPLNGMLDSHGYVFSSNPPYQVLRNSYLSAGELNLLLGFEDVFERYYNSSRFHVTLSYIAENNHFASHFDFFAALAEYYRSHELLFAGVSSRRMYDVLVDFLALHYTSDEMCHIKELLLYDYFASDSSDLPPESLRSVWKSERYYKNEAYALLEALGKAAGKENTVRFVSKKAYIFDYSERNPVTTRFDEIG